MGAFFLSANVRFHDLEDMSGDVLEDMSGDASRCQVHTSPPQASLLSTRVLALFIAKKPEDATVEDYKALSKPASALSSVPAARVSHMATGSHITGNSSCIWLLL